LSKRDLNKLTDHVLISVHPEYVRDIIAGKKTIELRRTNLQLQPGQTLWIYTTAPNSCVEVVAKINAVSRATPTYIWRKFGRLVGIDKAAFDSYAGAREQLTAIELVNVFQLESPLKLRDLRRIAGGFHPPQLAIYLRNPSSVLTALERRHCM
jgi:predicted transcriptional regulator